MKKEFKFNKTLVAKLPSAAANQRDIYHDTETKGLRLRVTPTGHKSFHIQRKNRGRLLRVTLGTFPDTTVDTARKRALVALGQIADGHNPTADKRAEESAEVTLRQVLTVYLKDKSKLKESTKKDYKRAIEETLQTYLDKPLRKLDRTKVRSINRRMATGKARTANAMRVLRALFNYAAEIYRNEDDETLFPVNPVETLAATDSWHEVKRKKSFIDKEAMPGWYEAVLALEDTSGRTNNVVAKMYFLFLLHTGCRRSEALELQVEDVDLKRGEFILEDTKNREDAVLPLSDYLVKILRPYLKGREGYVFPGRNDGRMDDPKRVLKEISEASMKFTAHDLRRTFLTIGEGVDIGGLTLKRLVNHKTAESDVTAGYIQRDTDHMRRATNRISHCILRLAESGKKSAVIELSPKTSSL